jgi:hypothetical protein
LLAAIHGELAHLIDMVIDHRLGPVFFHLISVPVDHRRERPPVARGDRAQTVRIAEQRPQIAVRRVPRWS